MIYNDEIAGMEIVAGNLLTGYDLFFLEWCPLQIWIKFTLLSSGAPKFSFVLSTYLKVYLSTLMKK